ncbi:MAG: redoxin domain-containing protein [Deltaproteobacteria bacterium]|nr:redoxin domain-containing protein [Deltaproteobacteria bacterium]
MKAHYLMFFALLIICLSNSSSSSSEISQDANWQPKEGGELIGKRAPSLEGLKWLNTEQLQIEDLRGKVVLIRFWLVGCPFCESTAPSLVDFYNKYQDDDFIIIGIHHPKAQAAKDPDVVLKKAKAFGFEFPIAQDNDWEVINEYWTGDEKRSYTSSSFLIDKKGVIRFVHDGGEYYLSENDKDPNLAYLTIDKKIRELISE